jgi:hypothetical protein
MCGYSCEPVLATEILKLTPNIWRRMPSTVWHTDAVQEGAEVKHFILRRMLSSGMLRRMTLVRTDASEELSTSIIRVTRIGEQRTTLAVTSNRCPRLCISSQRVSVVSYG